MPVAQTRQNNPEKLSDALLHRKHSRVQPDCRILWRFVWRGNPGELGNLPGARLLVQSPRIAALTDREVRCTALAPGRTRVAR